MSIEASYAVQGTGVTGHISAVAGDTQSYAQLLMQKYNDINSGSSDHFVATVADVESILKIYQRGVESGNVDSVLPQIISRIQNTQKLSRWFIAIMCACIYGCEGDNNLDVLNDVFETADPTNPTDFVPVEQVAITKPNGTPTNDYRDATDSEIQAGESYSKVFMANFWKKFKDDDNSYSAFSVDQNRHGLNVFSFEGANNGYHYPHILGTFSNKYFVIPIREANLDGWEGEMPNWKKKFLELCKNERTFLHDLQTPEKLLSVRERVLLHLSATSINPAAAPASLKLFSDIIQRCVSLKVGESQEVVLKNVPWYKTMCGMSFFKIRNSIDIENILNTNLYLGEENGKYYALYPFTRILADGLRKGECTIGNMTLGLQKVENHDGTRIEGASLGFTYTSKFIFIAGTGVPATGVDCIEVPGKKVKTYEAKDILGITNLRTMCMYPNLPLEYENRCKKYHYFGLEDAEIMTGKLSGVGGNIDLTDSIFLVSDGRRQILDTRSVVDMDRSPSMANGNYVTTSKIFQTTDGTKRKIYAMEADTPEHFIEVNYNNRCCGFILNIRTGEETQPTALMEEGNPVPTIDMSGGFTPAGSGELRAYVDFGSSSSSIQYKPIAAGAKLTEHMDVESTMRMMLADYTAENYQMLINSPKINNRHKFQSVSVLYNVNGLMTGQYSPYRESYMPVTNNLSEYIRQGVHTDVSHKTELMEKEKQLVVSAWIIIYNMCYQIACNAAAKGYQSVVIVPSIPSKDYVDKLSLAWNAAIADVMLIFDDSLTIEHTLNTDDEKCLYESIAISNHGGVIGTNELQISIDIGDGTTDMSAVVVDASGEKNVCGYSSVEYAGKNIMKRTIRDVLTHTTRANAETMLCGTPFYPPMFLVKDASDSEKYRDCVSNLLNDFYEADGKLRDEPAIQWENDIMDILSIAHLNSNLDQKIAADLIMRYLILMPVIKDFINTSIAIANSDRIVEKTDEGVVIKNEKGEPILEKTHVTRFSSGGNITITFYGGSSEGLKLLNSIDRKSTPKAFDLIEEYFRSAFTNIKDADGNTVSYKASVQFSPDDSKLLLIRGLSNLAVTKVHDKYQIKIAGVADDISWEKTVAPKKSEHFAGDYSIHTCVAPAEPYPEDAEQASKLKKSRKFETIAENDNNPKETRTHNDARIGNMQNYYADSMDAYKKFKAYFDDVIYSRLLDNHDGAPDASELVFQKFIDLTVHPNMKNAIDKQLVGANGSFIRAVKSSIYPEMVMNTVFMFAFSELMTEFFGNLPNIASNESMIRESGDVVASYKFGVS